MIGGQVLFCHVALRVRIGSKRSQVLPALHDLAQLATHLRCFRFPNAVILARHGCAFAVCREKAVRRRSIVTCLLERLELLNE